MREKCIVAVLFCLAAVFLFSSCQKTPEELLTEPYEEESNQTIRYLAEDRGIAVLRACSITGVFHEDGSAQDVTDVSGVYIVNNTDKTLQYAEISETFSDGTEYVYKVSTVPPGETCRVAEYSASPYRDLTHTSPTWDFRYIAFFQEEPVDYTSLLQISGAESILNVQNISGSEIKDTIVIYYKDYENGEFSSGITYRVTVPDGLAVNELKQITASHYVPDGSILMFVDFVPLEAE